MENTERIKPTEEEFLKIFEEACDEYEKEKGHSIDNDDHPEYILYAMSKVWDMKK